MLDGYTDGTYLDPNSYITESVSDSDDKDCYKFEVHDSNGKKIISNSAREIDKVRSCDKIYGIIKENKHKTPSNKYMDKLNNLHFSIGDIKSEDLIKFTNLYGAKGGSREKITDFTDISSMERLYDSSKVFERLKELKKQYDKVWETTGQSVKIAPLIEKVGAGYSVSNPSDKKLIPESSELIKFINPSKNDKYIVIGDMHGSFATFIRILFRLRKSNIIDKEGLLYPNYHLIFLGDIVDRGHYDYEIIIILYELILLNGIDRIYYNRGNHEDPGMNSANQPNDPKDHLLIHTIETQFGTDNDNNNWIRTNINILFMHQHSAILMKNPINDKYIYMSHGGLPLDYTEKNLKLLSSTNFIQDKDLILKENLRYSSSIKWADYNNNDDNDIYSCNGGRCLIGKNILKEAYDKGIELILRGHSDLGANTKILLKEGKSKLKKPDPNLEYFKSIQEIEPYGINTTDINKKYSCKEFTHIITLNDKPFDQTSIQSTNNTNNTNNIIINSKPQYDLLNVITLTTNTDTGRDLTHDSYAILSFQNETGPEFNCKEDKPKEDKPKEDKPKEDKLEIIPSKGIKNVGNSCYMNSVIQMLFSIKEFRDYLQKYKGDNINILSLKEIFGQLSDSSIPTATTKVGSIGTYKQTAYSILCNLFSGTEYEQEDAHVLLTYILDQFYHNSNIEKIFNSSEESYIVCNNNNNNKTNDPSLILNLPITSENIQNNLFDYMKPEQTDEKLELCKDNTGKHKGTQFLNIKIGDNQKYLFLELKRYEFDKNSYKTTKINNSIDILEEIIIDQNRFRLTGVVLHEGPTPNSGHYIYVQLDDAGKNVQTVYDDESVRTSLTEDSLKTESYILLYRKIGKVVSTNKTFVLTYNVDYKNMFNNDKKYCTNNIQSDTNCIKNIVDNIIGESNSIAKTKSISGDGVLDFIGLQEITNFVGKPYGDTTDTYEWNIFKQNIKNKFPDFDLYYNYVCKRIKTTYLTTFYNKIKYSYIRSDPIDLSFQACNVTYFNRILDNKLIAFINCHLYSNNQKDTLETLIKIVKSSNPIKPEYTEDKIPTEIFTTNMEIIICGDFGGDIDKINITDTIDKSKYFKFIDQTPQYKGNRDTCCNHMASSGWHDQIYHTEGLGSKIEYIIPDQQKFFKNYNYYTSYHKPVFAIISE